MMLECGGIIPLGNTFGLKIGSTSDDFVGIQLISYGINSKITYTVNRPKMKKEVNKEKKKEFKVVQEKWY